MWLTMAGLAGLALGGLTACGDKSAPAEKAEATKESAPADEESDADDASDDADGTEKVADAEDADDGDEAAVDDSADDDGGDAPDSPEAKADGTGSNADKSGAVAANGDKDASDKSGEDKALAESDDTKEKPAAQTEKGEATKEAAFATWLQAAPEYKVGQPGRVTAVVVPKGKYKCNAEYPFKFKVDNAAGLSFPETTVRGASISDKQTSISIPFTPSSAGSHRVSGTYSFSVCTAENCVIQRVPIGVAVNVVD